MGGARSASLLCCFNLGCFPGRTYIRYYCTCEIWVGLSVGFGSVFEEEEEEGRTRGGDCGLTNLSKVGEGEFNCRSE